MRVFKLVGRHPDIAAAIYVDDLKMTDFCRVGATRRRESI
jgi:hypothetical protein